MTGTRFQYMLYTIIDFFALVPWLPLPLSRATRHVYSNTRIDVPEKERLYNSQGRSGLPCEFDADLW